MPTYSYRCTGCGDEFDIHQSFSDEPLKVCEKCGSSLRKLFNSVGIVFKGSGFYHNDSKRSSSRSTDSTKAVSDAGSSGQAAGGSSQTSSGSDGSASRGHGARGEAAASAKPAPAPASS